MQVYEWCTDDPIAGPIDHMLIVEDDGSAFLSLNGQGHLPIPPERVQEMVAALEGQQ